VIIVCHNDGTWLPRCLDSVRAQTIFDRLELIVADNASTDGTDTLARRLIAAWPRARFLSTGGDHGFGVACNRAAELAQGDYLYLLNPDTWLEPDCLAQLLDTAERRQAEVVGSTVLAYDAPDLQAVPAVGFDFCGNGTTPSPRAAPEVLLCPAGFFFIRRDLFHRVGKMDTAFFMYGEEMDLSWRAWIAGARIVPAPAAKIHHRGAVGVNPAGGVRPAEHRTSVQKRFLANRNRLLWIAKDCQHVLLLLLVPCALVVLLEGLLTLLMTRNWQWARATSLDAIAGLWRLRGHIRAERRRIAAFRRRGDLWMLRFFRLGFGRWHEVATLLRRGFPRFQ